MSDNKLLAENTIRRFMKLANTDAFSDNFIAENQAEELEEEVEDTNEEINEEEEVELEENLEDLEEQEEDEEMEMDMEMDPDAEMDAGAEMDAEPDMGAADMSLTEEEAQLLISLGERLQAAMEGAAGDDEPVDDAPPVDDLEAPEGEDMEDEEDAPAYRMDENDQEDLVNEVLKRVTKRLVAQKLKNRK